MKLYKQNDDGSYEEVEPHRVYMTQENFQKDLDNHVKDRISKVESKYADYDSIKTSLDDANKKLGDFDSTKKSLEEQLAEKAKEVDAEKLNTVRVEVRNEFGLKKDLDKFLVGDTEDDIRSNAEILKKNGGAGGVTFNKDDKNPEGAKESASKTLANGLFGNAKE